uniref:Uncharacterized protein n=1 Tax=Anguilla anguilla TaxID=7936 RepID=A0A0E9RJ31_ANGAN
MGRVLHSISVMRKHT